MAGVSRLNFNKIKQLASIYLKDKQEVNLSDLLEDISPKYYAYTQGAYIGTVLKRNKVARFKDTELRLRPVICRCLPLGWKKKIVRSCETIIFEGNVLKKVRKVTVLFKEED